MKKLLYAEDDPDTRTSMVQLLRSIPNLEVIVAKDGQEAMDAISEDLAMVLVDFRMPHFSGNEVLKRVASKAPDAQRVILSAYNAQDLDSDWADIVLHKPQDLTVAFKMAKSLA